MGMTGMPRNDPKRPRRLVIPIFVPRRVLAAGEPKAASEEVKNKVYKNMSERAAGMLREEMETLGPVRMKEVSDAQQAINGIVQELEGKGELMSTNIVFLDELNFY